MTNNLQNSLPIGFFDSGVGGLSVLARFRELLPDENIIYFGDTIHLPYGSKTKEELIKYARNILDFMQNIGVKAVVIACNTSSAQAYDEIKNYYPFPIYPIIQTCAKAIAVNNYKRIGVFATEATVKSGKYSEELKKYNSNIQVKELASKNWVGIVEGVGENNDAERQQIKYELKEMLDFKPDKIILGCTHYPYLMDEFVKYTSKDMFIDPAEIFVKYIKHDLNMLNMLNNTNIKGEEQFYVSSNPEKFVDNAKIFYNLNKLPTVV